MNLTTIALILVLAGLMLYTALRLILAINQNFKIGLRFRILLANRIKNLRIRKMLKLHHINLNQYLHTAPILDIRHQVKNCETCANLIECDNTLSQDNIDIERLKFCPNDEIFRKVENKQ